MSEKTPGRISRRIFLRTAVTAIVAGGALFVPGLASASDRCGSRNDAGVANLDGCGREVRIAYLAGAYEKKEDETIVAALTARKVDVVIDGFNPIKVKVGSLNNSGVADEASARFRRELQVGGLTLNYIAFPVGLSKTVNVGIHRLNTDDTRRADKESNPPCMIVDTCLIQGGPDMNTLEGLRTIQVFSQNSKLGDGPGDYRNSQNDLEFQDPSRLFQGVELGYLLGR